MKYFGLTNLLTLPGTGTGTATQSTHFSMLSGTLTQTLIK